MSAKDKIIFIDKDALKRRVNTTKKKVTQSAKNQSTRILEKAKDNRNRIQNKLVDSGLFINDKSRDLLERLRR